MTSIPLITSIPPCITRLTDDGNDIGQKYLLRCVESWRNNGFDPISVNAVCEASSDLITNKNIKRINVEHDAREQYGKPLVYLRDFINAAQTATDGPVVITNADIYFDMSDATRHLIFNLKPGQCIVSKRIDVATMNSRNGSKYQYGYDFFAYHTADLKQFPDNSFVFGLPWWDHYLPIIMFLRGIKPILITEPFVYHLLHTKGLDMDSYVNLGSAFITLVKLETNPHTSHSAQLHANYSRRLKLAILGYTGSLKSFLRIRLKRLTARGRTEDDNHAFIRVSLYNEEWLNKQLGQ